jgi:hypothetical protein
MIPRTPLPFKPRPFPILVTIWSTGVLLELSWTEYLKPKSIPLQRSIEVLLKHPFNIPLTGLATFTSIPSSVILPNITLDGYPVAREYRD